MGALRYWRVFIPFAALLAAPLIWIYISGLWHEWLGILHLPKDPDDSTQWQLPVALGFHAFDVLNAILLFATLVYVVRSVAVAEAALNRSHHAYVQSLVDSRYDAMDKMYSDLLRERRERRYPYTPRSQVDAQTDLGVDGAHPIDNVDPYPLMVWNFIETIVDKCEKDPSGELMKTWAPLVSAEARNFGDWMLEEDDNKKPLHSPYFKNEFILLAKALVPASKQALDHGNDLEGSVFLRLFRALEKIKDLSELDEKSKPEPAYAAIGKRLKHERFAGFKDEEEFLMVFREIHNVPDLRKAAKDGWDLPESIRKDDLKNNEKERADFIHAPHCALIKMILPHTKAVVDRNGPANT